ncbi:hypothetical protein Tco_1474422 [Tanacetum coccineum]
MTTCTTGLLLNVVKPDVQDVAKTNVEADQEYADRQHLKISLLENLASATTVFIAVSSLKPFNDRMKSNHEDCSLMSTPMDLVEKFKPNTGKPVDQLKYSRAIGGLMYAMTSTRPDIAYVVGRLRRFTSNPSRQHWKAITRVFKYLREGYSDASWINHVEDSSSRSGWVFLLVRGAISWASKKQTCITGSTMEFEFEALDAASKEA